MRVSAHVSRAVAQLHMAHAESRLSRRAVTWGRRKFAFLTALLLLLVVAPTRPTERVSVPGGRARAREKPSNWVRLISFGRARQSSERVVAPKASIPHPGLECMYVFPTRGSTYRKTVSQKCSSHERRGPFISSVEYAYGERLVVHPAIRPVSPQCGLGHHISK